MNNDLATLITTAAATRTFTQNPAAINRLATEIEQRSGISRRAFLGALIGAGAAAVLVDPEKLLWTPTTKTLFVPPVNKELIVISEADLDMVVEYMGGMFRDPTAKAFNRSRLGMLSDEEFRMALDQARLQKAANSGIMYPGYA